MRIPSLIAALVLIGATLTPITLGQSEPAYSLKGPLPACDGTYAIVRLTEIKPDSNFEAYEKALALHKEWFRKNGYKDQIFAARAGAG
jgi:hypothetical protein